MASFFAADALSTIGSHVPKVSRNRCQLDSLALIGFPEISLVESLAGRISFGRRGTDIRNAMYSGLECGRPRASTAQCIAILCHAAGTQREV
jgi:hypothetical protein